MGGDRLLSAGAGRRGRSEPGAARDHAHWPQEQFEERLSEETPSPARDADERSRRPCSQM